MSFQVESFVEFLRTPSGAQLMVDAFAGKLPPALAYLDAVQPPPSSAIVHGVSSDCPAISPDCRAASGVAPPAEAISAATHVGDTGQTVMPTVGEKPKASFLYWG